MFSKNEYNEPGSSAYRIRFMSCVIAAELIMLGFFNFWPARENPSTQNRNVTFDDEVTVLNETVITRQASQPPPPPKPQVPVPVPNDEIIEEEIVRLDDINPSEFDDSLSTERFAGAGDSDQIASSPSRPPRIVRIVEAVTPDAAKKAGIKAEVTVSFLVDRQGNVEEASITEVRLYGEEGGSPKVLPTIGYGIPEATLNAALQWKFRPARNNGKPVRAYSKQIFTFGF